MNSIVEDCAHTCLLPDGHSALYDTLPSFDEDLGGDVTAEELSLPTPLEAIDESQSGQGSSLPATPAERPCTFCPSSLPLPPATCPNRVTLVLDLDGTLIASEELNSANSVYLWNPHAAARAPDYEAMGRRVWLRPGVREFLAAVRPHFEIVLFTAATQNWAATAVEQLDPAAELFDVMLHRDHTTSDLMWDYVKDLSRLGRDLSRVVIVDDNPLMFMYQPDNALHIAAYEASTSGGPDNVLEHVAEVLIGQVAVAEDVREVLGPRAAAKSCICSTVSSAPAAAAAAACALPLPVLTTQVTPGASETASMVLAAAAAAAGTVAADGSCPSSEAVVHDNGPACGAYTDAYDAASVSDAVMQSDGGGCDGSQYQQPSFEAGQPQQDASCRAEPGGCAPMEEVAAWDGESDAGAEQTFDANGAAAPLGAGAGPSSYRHWEQCQNPSSGADSNVTESAGSGAAEAAVTEAGEQEESDASPVTDEQYEGHTEHSSEDFEALMEDAIAEYDSDAFEDRYDKDLGYDGVCPAGTASASSLEGLGGPYSSACSGGSGALARLSSRSGGFGAADSRFRRGSAGPPGAFDSLYAEEQLGGSDDVGADLGRMGGTVLGAALPFNLFQIEAHQDLDAGMGLGKLTGCGVVTSSVGSDPAGAAVAGAAVGAAAVTVYPSSDLPAANGHQEQQCLQSRQPALPSGMVFLTDLNPSLGSAASGCGGAAAEEDLSAGICGDGPFGVKEALHAVVTAGQDGDCDDGRRVCHKRAFAEMEEGGGLGQAACVGGEQDVAAYTEDAARSHCSKARRCEGEGDLSAAGCASSSACESVVVGSLGLAAAGER